MAVDPALTALVDRLTDRLNKAVRPDWTGGEAREAALAVFAGHLEDDDFADRYRDRVWWVLKNISGARIETRQLVLVVWRAMDEAGDSARLLEGV